MQGTAYELLVRLHTESKFNTTKKPWWDTQPTPDQVLCTELLSEQDLDLLQSSWLVGCRRFGGWQPRHGVMIGEGDAPLQHKALLVYARIQGCRAVTIRPACPLGQPSLH